MKISFDFDETLSETIFQRLARALADAGVEVHIITSRCDTTLPDGRKGNRDIWAIAEYLMIPEERVHFTEGAFKAEIIRLEEIDLHFDDMEDEIHVIRVLSSCIAVNLKI